MGNNTGLMTPAAFKKDMRYSDPGSNDDCAILYKDYAFSGNSYTFKKSTYSITNFKHIKKNDEFSSLIVMPGCTFTGYWDSDFRGEKYEAKSGNGEKKRVSYIGDHWNDEMSSAVCTCKTKFWDIVYNFDRGQIAKKAPEDMGT